VPVKALTGGTILWQSPRLQDLFDAFFMMMISIKRFTDTLLQIQRVCCAAALTSLNYCKQSKMQNNLFE
jgi:hypothetical protein